MYSSIISQTLHLFWSWLFVLHFKLEIVGTGIASALTNFINLSICLFYSSMLNDIKEAIFFPDKRSFYGLREYLMIGIPQTILVCMEWWVFEIVTLLTGQFGYKYQAA
jgi:MATE family multidrug resistance protein